jgi:hypothetical protein
MGRYAGNAVCGPHGAGQDTLTLAVLDQPAKLIKAENAGAAAGPTAPRAFAAAPRTSVGWRTSGSGSFGWSSPSRAIRARTAGAASAQAFLRVTYVRGTLPAVRRVLQVTGLARGMDRLRVEA